MKPFKGLVIKPDSSKPEVVEFTTFEQVQEAVGGTVTHMPLHDHIREQLKIGLVDVLLNDEGKDVLPVNAEVTKLNAEGLFWGDYICGPAVLCGERNGGWLDVPAKLVQAVLGRYSALSAHENARRAMESGDTDFVVIVE